MAINKKILLIFVLAIFIVFSLLSLVPGYLFAQEEAEDEFVSLPEDLSIDVAFTEVINYGIIGSSFEFKAEVTYTGNEAKFFDFEVESPDGWEYVIKPQYDEKEISLVKLEPDNPETIRFVLRPLVPKDVGEYDVKLTLFSTEEGDDLQQSVDFLAIVKSAGDLEFKTESGRLNTAINKNGDNRFILLLENIGTGPVEDINLSVVDQPEGWLIEFEKNIGIIDVGEAVEVEANILPNEKTIAGDYNVRFLAQSDESSDFIDIRTTVKVPLAWQITGIAIIVIVVAGIAVLFERLGRR